MQTTIQKSLSEIQNDLVEFTQKVIRIKSLPGDEEKVARVFEQQMLELGFDEVKIDGMGNVLGRIGNGKRSIMFDSHMDVVEVNDEDQWLVPPFNGELVGNRLYGRGSVDMKSGATSSIYAAAIAKNLGLIDGKTIYVSCSVQEEDCDGENLKHLFNELNLRPDYVVICEPSDNIISLGHKGKAQVVIKTKGVSAHGSAPEKGKNAVYEMAEIIQRVEQTNKDLMSQGKQGSTGTLVLSDISCVTASLNAVPTECEIYLDRRMVLGESFATIQSEMDKIIKDKNASWQIGTIQRKSWKGKDVIYEPLHMAWKIDEEHPLTIASINAYKKYYGATPQKFDYWDYSTNGVTPVSLGIPTIGFGPGEYKLAHMINENVEISKIVDACGFYTALISEF